MNGLSRIATACLLSSLLAGCNTVGPRAIGSARYSYNEVISRTGNEQLLLNLVRLQYRDPPFFLGISSISTQYAFDVSAGTDAAKTSGSPGSVGLRSGMSFTERPTVTYSPLQGEQFVRQLLSPISLETVLLMYHSGWSIERVFRLCIQQLGPVKNAPGASGPTPSYVPPYREFSRVVQILRSLQVRDQLTVGSINGKGTSKEENVTLQVALRIAPEASATAAVAELRRLLGIRENINELRLGAGVGSGDTPGEIGVVTRSLLGVMFYLSQSVEVPERDLRAGLVTVTRHPSGEPFDWREVTGNLLHVRSGSTRPAHAAVAAMYQDTWFYIEPSDLESKSTFSLLTQLFALQAGEIKGPTPVLTLPLGPG